MTSTTNPADQAYIDQAYAAGLTAGRDTGMADATRARMIRKLNANSAAMRPIRHGFTKHDHKIFDAFQRTVGLSKYGSYGQTKVSYDAAMAFRRGFFATDDV